MEMSVNVCVCVCDSSQGADGDRADVHGHAVDTPDRRRVRRVRGASHVVSGTDGHVVQGHDRHQRRRPVPSRDPHGRRQLRPDADHHRRHEGRRRSLQGHRQDRRRRVQRQHQPEPRRFVPTPCSVAVVSIIAVHPCGVGKWVPAISWEGKGRYGSFRLRMNVWVCR